MAASSFSFDIVSEVDMSEVTNALDQARREITTRFDFKGTETEIDRDGDTLEIRSSTEDRLKAANEVLKDKLVRRGVSLKSVTDSQVFPAARGHSRQSVFVNTGINEDKAREITKFIRGLHPKVQTQVMGEQIRVTSKKKDDLQAVMGAVKEHDFGVALQFTNRRP
jgi:uncharacterized protein YajQ (UPF0234 family)